MRFAKAMLTLGALLLSGGVSGALGSWALATGAVVLLVAACSGAVALEARDHQSGIELATAPDPAPAAPVELAGLTDVA